MRFASRLIPHVGNSARGYFFVALGVAALGLGGCGDKHIGRACVTNAPMDAGTGSNPVSILSSPVLQCPSRICLQAAPTGTFLDVSVSQQEMEKPMCTDTCETDDDCSDVDPGTDCKHGFICAWPTTAGPFCCQKLCVCHDFINVPSGGLQEPNTCKSPSQGGPNPSTCQNVH